MIFYKMISFRNTCCFVLFYPLSIIQHPKCQDSQVLTFLGFQINFLVSVNNQDLHFSQVLANGSERALIEESGFQRLSLPCSPSCFVTAFSTIPQASTRVTTYGLAC